MEIEKIGMISSVPKVGDTGAYAWHHAQNCLLYGVYSKVSVVQGLPKY